MNPYLAFVLAVLVLEFLLETLADWLELTQKKPAVADLPELADVLSAFKYEEGLRYQREQTLLRLARRTVFFAALLTFLLAGGFGAVDIWARDLSGASETESLASASVFVASLAVLRFLLQLPFSLYATFNLEQRYGFNRTTPGTFAADTLKGALLALLIGVPLYLGVVAFFVRAGAHGWWLAWLFISLTQLVLLYLAPAIILPLFNHFTPLPEGPARQAIERFVSSLGGFQLEGIYTMDGSKRSTKANAFFTGFGRFRKLVLFDTLLEKHTEQELVAVLAHEIGHFRQKHILKFLFLSLASSLLMFWVFSLLLGNAELAAAFGLSQASVYATLVFAGFLYAPLSRILGIATQAISRRFEFEADRFAARTSDAEALGRALKKLSVDHLSNLTPHPLKVALEYSHPPLLERLQALTTRSAPGP